MDPRLAGFTQRLQSIPGASIPPTEIAERVQYVYNRLKGQAPPPLSGPQAGGRIPRNLATHAKRGLFSSTGAFPMKGGASFLEGLAENPALMQKAVGFAQSPQGQQMFGQAKDLAGQAQGLAGQAQGLAQGLAGGLLSALPRAKGPTLESFLESQGVPQIPVTAKKVPGDFLGNAARWWVKAASSPYLGTLVKLTFFFMFFISFLESTPLVGSVVSVALDAVLAGGRILVKVLQKGIPTLVGLIPLPYSQMAGVALVSVIGMFVWTILATISFGRQDFTSAIDSMLRIIPVPIGDALADSFLDINRTVDQFNDKRIKLTDDVWNGMLLLQQFLAGISQTVQSTAGDAFSRVQSGANTLLDAIRGVREGTPVPEPGIPMAQPIPEAGIPMAQPIPEPGGPVAAPMATPIPDAGIPMAQPIPEPPIPTAVPVAEPPIPTAVPVAEPPIPTAVPVAEPTAPIPEPTAPPVQEPAPTAPPAPEPTPPQPTAPPAFEMGPQPAQSALDRLRSGQSVNRTLDVGRGFRGGKPLSGRQRTKRKWKHPLYERFYGLGSR